jgi:hypothetical protein
LPGGELDSGPHVSEWSGADPALRNGIYFVELEIDGALAARSKVAVLQ